MQNKITVIGTVHNATKNYSADDLYNKLCDIKPDLILFEFPLEWEKHLEAQLDYAARTGLVEANAYVKYSKEHQVDIKLYDIEGRNDFYMKTRCFEIEKESGKAYLDYFKSENPNKTALAYKKLKDKLGKIQDEQDNGSLEAINSQTCDIVTETYLETSRILYSTILDLVPELHKYKAGYLKQERYENKRTKAMVKNILGYNRQYDNKTIVVLCGFYHRFALLNALSKKQKSDSFELITSIN